MRPSCASSSPRLDADLLERRVSAYLWIHTHVVVVFGHAGWTVFGQGAVAAKSDEAIAVPTLFAFVELTCAVIIVDALHVPPTPRNDRWTAGSSCAASRDSTPPPRPGRTNCSPPGATTRSSPTAT